MNYLVIIPHKNSCSCSENSSFICLKIPNRNKTFFQNLFYLNIFNWIHYSLSLSLSLSLSFLSWSYTLCLFQNFCVYISPNLPYIRPARWQLERWVKKVVYIYIYIYIFFFFLKFLKKLFDWIFFKSFLLFRPRSFYLLNECVWERERERDRERERERVCMCVNLSYWSSWHLLLSLFLLFCHCMRIYLFNFLSPSFFHSLHHSHLHIYALQFH